MGLTSEQICIRLGHGLVFPPCIFGLLWAAFGPLLEAKSEDIYYWVDG